MKLSEAIRLGAMLKPQGFRALNYGGRTCAYGAAYEAAGVPSDEWRKLPKGEAQARLFVVFPLIETLMQPCPACGLDDWKGAGFVVTHLNDIHRWSREQIADWVESIERQGAESVSRPAFAAMSTHPRDAASSEVHSLHPVTKSPSGDLTVAIGE